MVCSAFNTDAVPPFRASQLLQLFFRHHCLQFAYSLHSISVCTSCRSVGSHHSPPNLFPFLKTPLLRQDHFPKEGTAGKPTDATDSEAIQFCPKAQTERAKGYRQRNRGDAYEKAVCVSGRLVNDHQGSTQRHGSYNRLY